MNYEVSDLVVVVLATMFLLIVGGAVLKDPEKTKHPELKEKTLYLELCADEGITAFQCYDKWLRIKYNGN